MDSNHSVTYNAGDLLFFDDEDSGMFKIDFVLFQSHNAYQCVYSKRKKITHPIVIDQHYDNVKEIFKGWTLIA